MALQKSGGMHHGLIGCIARTALLEHVIEPKRGSLPPELARHILTWDFPREDHARYEQLSEKAQEWTLSEDERMELDDFLNVSDFLAIIQTKARTSLKRLS
jgi:hypothetical protein